MEPPEIVPLENKTLNVIVVEKEYNEPFWITKPSTSATKKETAPFHRSSIIFQIFLEKLIQRADPDYATEESGNRTVKEFQENNVIAQLFKKSRVPFFATDIDKTAKEEFTSSITEKRKLQERVIDALDELSRVADLSTQTSVQKEYLAACAQCVQQEIEEAEKEGNFSVRESWIVNGIINQARALEKNEVAVIHLSSPEHVSGVRYLLESVGCEVQVIQLAKKLVFASPKTPVTGLSDLLESMQIQAKPIIKKTAEEPPYLLFFFDTDKRASPFDINMAYDAGFSAVIPYEDVTPEDAKRLAQDAIFSRDPKGIRRTCFFIGGKDMEKAEAVLKAVREAMFPPFETSTIIDPAGAYTTASAMIGKVEEALPRSKLGNLKDKGCAIFGTGAVGRIAAILLARMNCPTMIVSPNPERTNGKEYIEGISKLLLERYNVNVVGAFSPTNADKIKIIEKNDVILCASAAGVRIIDKDMLKELQPTKVIADINAVAPFGVDGMNLDDDMREIAPGVFAIGALTIGRLKYKLEQQTLREARRKEKGIYNYDFAVQLARRILRGEISARELTVTLTYPPEMKSN